MSDGGSAELDETEVEARVFRELLEYVSRMLMKSPPLSFTLCLPKELSSKSVHRTHFRYIYTDKLSPGALKTMGESLLLAAHKYVQCSIHSTF